MNKINLIGAIALACGAAAAQPMPIFRVSVTSGTVKAISYQHRSGSTKVDFRGTDLLPVVRAAKAKGRKQAGPHRNRKPTSTAYNPPLKTAF